MFFRLMPVVVPFLFLLILNGCSRPSEPACPPVAPLPPPPTLQPVSWGQVEGWPEQGMAEALPAFLQSCRSLSREARWKEVCEAAGAVDSGSQEEVRNFFETRFVPHQVNNADGTATGTVTGYYAPDLAGSRVPNDRFRYPLYGIPEDLLVIDLGQLYPELKNYRLRGRVEGRKVVPYYSRAEIDEGRNPIRSKELFWVEDPVELFFLHIQGSGRIRLPDGNKIFVNYAEQNGHPYASIGKVLIDRQELPADGMSMQAIRAWAESNPEKAKDVLNQNPSYVFFRELPVDVQTPPGALGVPLTPERSLAVDRRYVPLGAPVFLSTTWPNTQFPLWRLMMAQDTGGAIKGAVRADFFWGVGDLAGEYAGRMKQQGRMWVLLPAENTVPTAVAENR